MKNDKRLQMKEYDKEQKKGTEKRRKRRNKERHNIVVRGETRR